MRRQWTINDISLLITLNKEKVPLKILSWIFDVTYNAVSKTLGRYIGHQGLHLERMPLPFKENFFYKELLILLNKNVNVKLMIKNSNDFSNKTIWINKFLHQYGWPPMNQDEIKKLLEEL